MCGVVGILFLPNARPMLRTANIAHTSCPIAHENWSALTSSEGYDWLVSP